MYFSSEFSLCSTKWFLLTSWSFIGVKEESKHNRLAEYRGRGFQLLLSLISSFIGCFQPPLLLRAVGGCALARGAVDAVSFSAMVLQRMGVLKRRSTGVFASEKSKNRITPEVRSFFFH